MKNVYLIDEHISSRANGIGPFIKAYIACLKKMKVNITVLSFNEKTEEFDIIHEKGVRKFLFPAFATDHFPAFHRIINRFLLLYLEDSPDSVFCFNHAPCKEMFRTVRESFPLSRLVFTIHDMGWTQSLNGDTALLQQIIASRQKRSVRLRHKYILDFFDTEIQTYALADAVVCLSETTRHILRDIYRVDPRKIFRIPSGMQEIKPRMTAEDKARFRQAMHIGPQEKIIFYAGRLSAAKGIYPLVNAFAGVVSKWPQARLVLAGSANPEWNTFLSAISHLSPKITVTGFIPKKELRKWYQVADIGIIPSYYEQCPYTAIEMMMHGLPMVVSDGNGLKDMFRDLVNAKVAPIGNRASEKEYTAQLFTALDTLLSSETLCATLGQKARQTYRTLYSLSPMQRRYGEFFRQLEILKDQ